MIHDRDPVSEKSIDVIELLNQNFPNLTSEILEVYRHIQETDPTILFPSDIDTEKLPIDTYTIRHQYMYDKQSDEVVDKDWEVLVIGSGMYGGKSTLSFYILDKFSSIEFDTKIYIAEVMGENYVTARSYPGENKLRLATRYGKDSKELNLPKGKNSIVILDEFSFLDLESIKSFVEDCRKNNVKVILTGLNTNYLGDNLPVFNQLHKIVGKHKLVECKSFVPGIDINIPTGSKTTRFVNINGIWIKDFGILPLVVSKEYKEIVHYSAATEEQTFKNIFRNKFDLLNHVLHPSKALVDTQKARLRQLIDMKSENTVT